MKKWSKKLQQIFLIHDLWYGESSRVITSEEIDIGDLEDCLCYSVIVSFVPILDKQMFVNIIIHTNNDKNTSYFFTWYDNNDFEESTKNGEEMTEEDFEELCKYLYNAGFKSDYNELKEVKFEKGCIDYLYIKEEE